jgi:FKBP-type peptidyl-prolyl cis-trans isomerase
MVRNDDGRPFIDHAITLGRRQAIAGIEQALLGMKQGGYRKVRISPHLAYGEKGLPGLIPARAVLIAELWLRDIIPE